MRSSRENKLAVFVDSLKVCSVIPCNTQICIYSLNFKKVHLSNYIGALNEGKKEIYKKGKIIMLEIC